MTLTDQHPAHQPSTDQQDVDQQVVDQQDAAPDLVRVKEFADKVHADTAVAVNSVLTYLGDRLGLWRALASGEPVTSTELAARTGLAERYLREWLAAQAAAGYLLHDGGRFRLPFEHALVLADDDSPAASAGGLEFTAAAWSGVDRLADAFTTGEGIAWGEQDDRLATSVERFFRPLYRGALLPVWVPAVDGLQERLEAGAAVLDVGCGLGTATRMLAAAFPASRFVGVDTHEPSVRRAREAAAEAGVADRVSFRIGDAADGADERFDVVCFFDVLHDLGDPVGALRAARSRLVDGGLLMVVEPHAEDALDDNLHARGLAWFTASAVACVPGSLAQHGQAALGAQAGPARTLEVLTAAGFDSARVAVATDYNLVYEARR